MTSKKLKPDIIGEFLSLSKAYVLQIQKELKAEVKILALLAKKQKPAQIAKKLKVSEWLVEIILELKLKKPKK